MKYPLSPKIVDSIRSLSLLRTDKLNIFLAILIGFCYSNNLIDKKELEKIILVKVPTEVYPVLYETFVYLFSQAGIKNISIEKEINFEKMYNEKYKS